MGLLDRLFRTDPHAALERAENLLARGEAAEALRLVERVGNGGSLALSHRVESLARRAQDALADAALEKAELAEASGFFEDAAEWIEAACVQVTDEGRRAELERRAAALLERADVESRKRRSAAMEERLAEASAGDAAEGGAEIELDDHYDALVNMFDDDVAERYEGLPEAFRRAFVALNEGRPGEARETLEELAESRPESPVYLLERGRCRLATGDLEGARQDLEAVWETFGDEPMDHAKTLSVPGLWSEAMLGLKRFDELLERLDEVAVPAEGDAVVCQNYALALMLAGRLDPALRYLGEAMNYFSQPEFPHRLAAVLNVQGKKREAIDVLERAVAPSCSPVSCRTVAKHVPSLRSLAGLYLDEGRRLERVEELAAHIAQAQGGNLQAEDYLLLAEYHQQRGDPEAAREAAARARQLREAAADGHPRPLDA